MNKRLLYTVAFTTTALIILYYLSKKGILPVLPGIQPEKPKPPEEQVPSIPKVDIIPIYPEPGSYHFHWRTRQEVEVEIVNKSNYGVELYVSGVFEVPDLAFKQELFTQRIELEPGERKRVKWNVDFPYVHPWEVKKARVYVTVKDRLGRKIAEKEWYFYIKGFPI